jgi:hypothetical protein
VLAVTLALGCGNKTDDESNETDEPAQDEPAVLDAAAKPVAPDARRLSLAEGFAALPEAPAAVPPMKAQLGNKIMKATFLGFTQDGRHFALKIDHEYFFGEEIGTYELNIYQMYDAWTGKATMAFRRSHGDHMDGDPKDFPRLRTYRKVWKEARPRKEWKQWTADNPLVASEPTRVINGGELTGKANGKPPHKTRLAFKNKDSGIRMRWSKLSGEIEGRPKKLPEVTLSWTAPDGTQIPSLVFKPGYSWMLDFVYGDGADKAYVDLNMAAYPSPGAERFVWFLRRTEHEVTLEMSMPPVRFYVRTPGHQVKVLASGSGQDHARRAATAIEAAGVPVVEVGDGKEPTPATKIYYRGDARPVAEVIQRALPGAVPIEQLTAEGWVDVIVVLGEDAAAPRSAVRE